MHDPVVALNDDLLALAAERTELADANAQHEMVGGCPRDIDAAFVAHSVKWHPMMRRLADTPATSIDGIIVKLRTLAESLIAGRESIYDEDILLLTIADLERLSEAHKPAS